MTALFSLENIAYQLGDKKILEGISATIATGEFVGLIGPNGAGKSTLLRIAAGLQAPTTGVCKISGAPLGSLPHAERARRVSYLPQTREVAWAISAREIVALGRFAWGAPLHETPEDAAAVTQALNETGAAGFADRLAHTLSGGELARVHLARLLAGHTPVILADEPVAALDPAHQLSVMKLLRAKADEGRAIIAALHELPLAARYCSRLIVLQEGKIAADGSPDDILNDELMQAVFGVRVSLETRDGKLSVHLYPMTD